jgi:hypothetical protein
MHNYTFTLTFAWIVVVAVQRARPGDILLYCLREWLAGPYRKEAHLSLVPLPRSSGHGWTLFLPFSGSVPKFLRLTVSEILHSIIDYKLGWDDKI